MRCNLSIRTVAKGQSMYAGSAVRILLLSLTHYQDILPLQYPIQQLRFEMMKVNSLDRQLDLETYLVDVSIGCSNPPPALRRIGASN